MAKYRYAWIKDDPDAAYAPDPVFSPNLQVMAIAPKVVDLRSVCPPVYNQTDIGCCTGESTAGAVEILQIKENLPHFQPSALFAYYNGRAIEGTTDQDVGAQIRDVVNGIYRYGICPESDWALDDSRVTVKPPQKAYTDAKLTKLVRYARASRSINQFRTALASGYPVVIGIAVYDSFETDTVANNGVVPMPDMNTENLLGGHAVCVVGYNDNTQRFTVRNSWGNSWGDGGYFYLPYGFITNAYLSGDFWVIYSVSGLKATSMATEVERVGWNDV